jgi:enamine deaminase RidA (YjgF/YER057c/UK114 family)
VRSKYYGTVDFKDGYPAATGIGMGWGGVVIDFVAANPDAVQSVGIKSPVQFDAYIYSKEVLAENCTMIDYYRTTPKFERARLVNVCGAKWIFISGTTAIVGQVSDPQNSVEHQTERTIDNIRRLISAENIRRFGIETVVDPEITYLRVYVKHKADFEIVKQICCKHFTTIPLSLLVADVCRPELLLEIEGHAVLE